MQKTKEDEFTIATVTRILAELPIPNILAIMNIVAMMKDEEKLKNITDNMIYSYYLAELETEPELENRD